MTTSTLTEASLEQFIGSETLYRHPLSGCLFTEGVKFVADQGGAYWLLDKVTLLTRHESKLSEEAFAVWKLEVNNRSAVLRCEDGDENEIYSERVNHTDFPLDRIEIWREGNIFLLPCQH